MAALGRREMSKKNHQRPSEVPAGGISAPAVNLAASPIKIEPVTTMGFQPAFPGSPIMREDFITRTGFIPTKLS